MDLDSVSVHKQAKKRTDSTSSELEGTSLVNKGFIVWKKNFLRDTAGNPEQRHLARAGSQSQCRIRFAIAIAI